MVAQRSMRKSTSVFKVRVQSEEGMTDGTFHDIFGMLRSRGKVHRTVWDETSNPGLATFTLNHEGEAANIAEFLQVNLQEMGVISNVELHQ